jgi:hypothetical protein
MSNFEPNPADSGYTDVLVSFVDVLGFSQLVKSRSCAEIASVIDMMQWVNADSQSNFVRVMNFSDSAIRLTSTAERGALFFELIALVHAQLEMAAKGVFLRGGVTVGGVHWSDQTIFGPGFIEAYRLESEFATYPRIVVSPKALDALKASKLLPAPHHSIEMEFGYVMGLLRRGSDGVWFVDYLKAALSEMDEPDLYGEYLKKHKSGIVDMSAAGKGEVSSISIKANWLGMYHNEVLGEFTDESLESLGYSREDLRITADDVPTLFFP